MKDLRIKNERRSFKPAPRFPFVDSNGDVIRFDRRKVPDRRLNSISLEVVPMEIITAEGDATGQ